MLTGPLIRTDSNNCCGVLLTLLSWVLIVATMPFSMCLCLKVCPIATLYIKNIGVASEEYGGRRPPIRARTGRGICRKPSSSFGGGR